MSEDQLSLQLISEINKDHMFKGLLHERLRLIMDLVSIGADPCYIDISNPIKGHVTPLERALMGDLPLHAKLLMHLGAKITQIEIGAINTLNMSSRALFRICPELRKYHNYEKRYPTEEDDSFLLAVDNWIHSDRCQLKEDPEILFIVFADAKINLTPYLRYFNDLLPEDCLTSIHLRFGSDVYIRIWMKKNPHITDLLWDTYQCSIGVYTQSTCLSDSMIQTAASSTYSHNRTSAMYDATSMLLHYDSTKKAYLKAYLKGRK